MRNKFEIFWWFRSERRISNRRKITNIDVSNVVVKRMQQKYAKNRPGLRYLRMDALQTEFESESFTTIFDKGTLDALFPDNTEESLSRITRLFDVMILHHLQPRSYLSSIYLLLARRKLTDCWKLAAATFALVYCRNSSSISVSNISSKKVG